MEIPEWNEEDQDAAVAAVDPEEEDKVEFDDEDTGDQEFQNMLTEKRIVINKYTGLAEEVSNQDREK